MRIFLSVWLLVFSAGMFIYWTFGGNFERNMFLGIFVFGSTLMATIVALFVATAWKGSEFYGVRRH